MHTVVMKPLQYLPQVLEVVAVRVAGNQYVIKVAQHIGNALENGVHGTLEHRRCRGNPKGYSCVAIEPFVSADGLEEGVSRTIWW